MYEYEKEALLEYNLILQEEKELRENPTKFIKEAIDWLNEGQDEPDIIEPVEEVIKVHEAGVEYGTGTRGVKLDVTVKWEGGNIERVVFGHYLIAGSWSTPGDEEYYFDVVEEEGNGEGVNMRMLALLAVITIFGACLQDEPGDPSSPTSTFPSRSPSVSEPPKKPSIYVAEQYEGSQFGVAISYFGDEDLPRLRDDLLGANETLMGLLVLVRRPVGPGALDESDGRLDQHQLQLLGCGGHHFCFPVTVSW